MHYYQHHIGDFIRATARLSDSQCMAYLRMLWLYYENEQPLDCDADAIAFKIGANASDVHQILKHFFFLHDGKWHNPRCDKEILEFKAKSDKARDSANARWANAKAMRTHSKRNPNEPVLDANQEPVTSKPIKEKKLPRAPRLAVFEADPNFEKFWAIYDKKVGRAECEMIWRKINPDDQTIEKILSAAAAYRAAQPEKQFRKDPSGWLNKKCWNDEIIKRDNGGAQQSMTHQQATKLAASRTIFGDERSLANDPRTIDVTTPQIAG